MTKCNNIRVKIFKNDKYKTTAAIAWYRLPPTRLKEAVPHPFHMGSCVAVEHFIPATQGVEAFLPVISDREPVLGAFSVAQTHPLASEAFHRKGVSLGYAETDHFG